MKTAEEILSKDTYRFLESNPKHKIYVVEAMKEYARQHVRKALQSAMKNADTVTETFGSPYQENWTKVVDKQSIITSYPLKNIK